jgi:exodeoxyribonuclease VII large subunit
MSDLFSLPFEEVPDPGDEADMEVPSSRAPVPRSQTPAPSDPAGTPASSARGQAAPAQRRRIFTVSELTATIRGVLENFGDVWVEGEISNCRVWNTGHMYFTLKDGGAQIKAVMFRSAVRYLKFKPDDGLHVVARGRLGVYDPKGEYQLVCEHVEPHGLGALQLAFEQLKKKLQAEGLFDQSRKRPLPSLPRKIGIVTSLDGAALRDIIKVLRRRHPNAHLVIRPTRVQGDGAAADIAQALRAIGKVKGVDVVIAARGGGSIEDLWAFNQEPVARAIAACPVPVISAVGHEVDFTIADFVADLRAPTPSAAAEMVVAAKEDFCGRIERLAGRLHTAARHGVQRRRTTVQTLVSRRGLAGWQARLAMRSRHAAELTHHLKRSVLARLSRQDREYRGLRQRLEAHDLRRRLAGIRGRLAASDGRLRAAGVRGRERADARFRVLAGRLNNLSPLAVLARGYAVCWNEERTAIIRRASETAPGDRVRVTLHEGELECVVKPERRDG